MTPEPDRPALAAYRDQQLVRRVEQVRLEAHPQFFDFFVQGCQFVPFGSAA